MKRLFALLLVAAAAGTCSAQSDVGVSVSVTRPGVYGRIDIGNVSPPVVYDQPIIILQRAPVVVQQQPLYLYVPAGHQTHWAKHCAKYKACGQPVYFVQESWVRERYEEDQGKERAGKKEKKEKKQKGKHGGD